MSRYLCAAIALLLAGCVQSPAPVVVDAGCAEYGRQRGAMPPLDLQPLSVWVAVMDSGMTGTCVG